VKEALERVNMAHRMRHYPAQLSAATAARGVARALAGARRFCWLMSLPQPGLEERRGVMHLLTDLHREGSTICMVTHDPRFAKHAQRECISSTESCFRAGAEEARREWSIAVLFRTCVTRCGNCARTRIHRSGGGTLALALPLTDGLQLD